jgi:hypothetical protein
VRKKEKSLRVKYGITVREMNVAVRRTFEFGACRLVPARQRPLPARTQRAIERHENGLCSCAAKIAQLRSKEPEYQGAYSVEAECAAAIEQLKIKAWNKASPEYDPILTAFSVKLYGDYANQNIKVDAATKVRLESIEDFVIEFNLHTPICPDIIKPLKGERYDPIDDDDWEWEPDVATVVTAREILGQFNVNDDFDPNDAQGEIKNAGLTKKGRPKPLSSFDLSIQEDRETRKVEKETAAWVRKFLADKSEGKEKTYKQVEADLDKLFLGSK